MNWSVSATQIDLWNMCHRRFAFQYLEGKKPPQHPAAAFGTELHTIAEQYLTVGKSPDELTQAGELFVRGLPYLPPPRSGGVEGEFRFEMNDVKYLLRVDYRGERVPGLPGRVLLDHKTSSDPKEYGVWGDEFLKNPQTVLYATYDMLSAGDDKSQCRWLYYWTKGKPKAEPSDFLFTQSMLEDVFEPVVQVPAKQILELKSAPVAANDLDPNTESCKLFGKEGCPHHPKNGGDCNVTKAQTIRGALVSLKKKKEKPKMAELSMLEKMKARKAAKASGEAAAEPEKEDKVNPPEAKQAAAPKQEEEKPAAKVSQLRTAPVRAVSDEPSDEEVGRVVKYLLSRGAKVAL